MYALLLRIPKCRKLRVFWRHFFASKTEVADFVLKISSLFDPSLLILGQNLNNWWTHDFQCCAQLIMEEFADEL